jgi:hypothetical protein
MPVNKRSNIGILSGVGNGIVLNAESLLSFQNISQRKVPTFGTL